jgi:hypothetical protein
LRSAPRAESVAKAPKVLFPNLVENLSHRAIPSGRCLPSVFRIQALRDGCAR